LGARCRDCGYRQIVSLLSVGYADNGNITTKSDAGSFDFTTGRAGCSYPVLPAQPQTVRQAGSTVYCYDASGNMLSRREHDQLVLLQSAKPD